MNVKTKRLSNKEIREFLKNHDLDGHFTKKDVYEDVSTKEVRMLLINRKPSFFYQEEIAIPTLHLLQEANILKFITVDKGAIKFVVNGADIMRVGIVEIDTSIDKDDLIAIKEETYGKVIAVGKALVSSEEMESMKSGKAIKNIHFIGDKIYNFKI